MFEVAVSLLPFSDLPASPTKTEYYQKISNSGFSYSVWMKFGLRANIGPKTAKNQFEKATAIFPATIPTNKKPNNNKN